MRHYFLFSFLFLAGVSLQAAQPSCLSIFEQKIPVFERLIISKKVYSAKLKKLETLKAEIKEILNRDNVSQILINDASPLTRDRLIYILDQINSKTATEAFVSLLQSHLQNYVPARQINERIENLLQKKDTQSLRRALGEKTLQETQELVYGENPESPSPESLMGQYLVEAKALFEKRKYGGGPGSKLSAHKYAVSINQEMSNIFYKYFFDIPELLFHYHTPGQGTLVIVFDKKMITYAGGGRQDISDLLEVNAILPMVVLSTSEAHRLVNYFSLGGINQTFAKEPWEKIPQYCARGGYNSCTHWFGEMPVGDKLVASYVYPGKVDYHADNDVGPGPQRKKLKEFVDTPEYEDALQNSNYDYSRISQRIENLVGGKIENINKQVITDKLVRLVWTVPGAQHFADMLGQQDGKLRGEFANPGYVARILIGRTSLQRVPYVFHVGTSSTKKISRYLGINAY